MALLVIICAIGYLVSQTVQEKKMSLYTYIFCIAMCILAITLPIIASLIGMCIVGSAVCFAVGSLIENY